MSELNDYLLSFILGIVEGVTEFLPVSSTAHLRIGEALLGVSLDDGYWKMFSIVIQLGAILCLPIYFWKRIFGFSHDVPGGRARRQDRDHPSPRAHADRFFLHGRAFFSPYEGHWKTPGEPRADGVGTNHWRGRDVDRRCHVRPAQRRVV